MDSLAGLEKQLAEQSSKPPLHLWNPPLSGDIDIVIKRNGDWIHEQGKIERQGLVNLFASILRREGNEYFLLTPVEKWRIQVENTALHIKQCDVFDEGTEQQSVLVQTNTDEKYFLSEEFPLLMQAKPAGQGEGELQPIVQLDYGISAVLDSPAYYHLAEFCKQTKDGYALLSKGKWFSL
ncbi:MAG: hypothetical protein ACJAYG_000932 [Oceanicoccus sp.]|jgi:hypothetical protein